MTLNSFSRSYGLNGYIFSKHFSFHRHVIIDLVGQGWAQFEILVLKASNRYRWGEKHEWLEPHTRKPGVQKMCGWGWLSKADPGSLGPSGACSFLSAAASPRLLQVMIQQLARKRVSLSPPLPHSLRLSLSGLPKRPETEQHSCECTFPAPQIQLPDVLEPRSLELGSSSQWPWLHFIPSQTLLNLSCRSPAVWDLRNALRYGRCPQTCLKLWTHFCKRSLRRWSVCEAGKCGTSLEERGEVWKEGPVAWLLLCSPRIPWGPELAPGSGSH